MHAYVGTACELEHTRRDYNHLSARRSIYMIVLSMITTLQCDELALGQERPIYRDRTYMHTFSRRRPTRRAGPCSCRRRPVPLGPIRYI